MKNKLSKTLLTFLFSITFIIGIPFVAHADEPRVELIPSPDGNIIKIHNVPNETNIIREIVRERNYHYKHAIVTGKMCSSYFLSLALIFSDCKSIDLSEVDADEIPNAIFSRNNKLERFVFPANLKYIRELSFESCYNLKIDKLPQSLKYIGCYAFENCWKLNLTIPDKVFVDTGAFGSCQNVKLPEHVHFPEINSDKVSTSQSQSDSDEIYTPQPKSNSKSILNSIISSLLSLLRMFRIY